MGRLKMDTIHSADKFSDMLYCANPNCSNPFNSEDNKFCIKCGQTLTPLFRNRFRVMRLLGEGGFGRKMIFGYSGAWEDFFALIMAYGL